MAAVYLAHDTRHDRTVALKVLRPSPPPASATFYTMPYVEGESLRSRPRARSS